MIAVGDAVEVAGLAEAGCPQCWLVGSIVEIQQPVGAAIVPMLTVALRQGDEPCIEEWHPSASLRVRPALPASLVAGDINEYQAGEPVDVLDQAVWWHAVVCDRCSDRGLHISFIGSPEKRWVADVALVRPGRIWVAGTWWPRPLPPLPRGLICKPTQQQQLQQVKAVGRPAGKKQVAGKTASQAVGSGASTLERNASNDENGGGAVMVRRSARDRQSRVTLVDGQPVLKLNMYDLEGGERSVFDQELNRQQRQPGAGTAAPCAAWVPVEHPAKRQKAVPKTKAGDATEGWRAGDVGAHNMAIRADAKAMEGPRAVFLDEHLQVLRPFIAAEVAAAVHSRAAAARAAGLPPLPPPVDVQPDCLAATLREYQLEGLRWLVGMWDRGVNAILADEMGLGKTLQTISLLSYLKFERGVQGPHLVVVPLSVLSSWMDEFKRWSPQMRVVRLHTGDVSERQRIRRDVLSHPSSFDVAVTTYDMAKSKDWAAVLGRTIDWRYLVLDEGHRIKNEGTQLAAAMRLIHRQHTLLLTGTPLQNDLHELYALLSYLYPDLFTTSCPFDNAFCLKEHKVDIAQLEAAHHMLAPFCLRRLKREVELSLPPLVETRISCPLSAMQTFWYRRLLMKDGPALLRMEKEVEGKVKYDTGDTSYRRLLMLVQQLRKCCNHPYLFPGAEPDFDGHSTGEDIVEACGKMDVLDRLLGKLQRRGHRAVLFSQFNMQLDILEDYLNLRGYRYCRLDGSTNRVQRMIDMKLFNRPGSDIFVYLLNTRAGGLGVNLQTADTCILYDSDWNPQADLQAMARVHRIGQTKPVHVYRLCTDGTIEQRIQQRAEKKLFLDQMVNRGSVAGLEGLESLSKQEVLGMLRFGCDRIFQADKGRPPSDAELDAVIARSGSRGSAGVAAAPVSAQARRKVKTKVKEDAEAVVVPREPAPLLEGKTSAANFDAELKPLSSYVFGGVDYLKVDSIRDIGRAFWEGQGRGKRDRQTRLVRVDGHDVLRSNMYSLEEGEPSVYEREAAAKGRPVKPAKGQRTPQEHQDYCQACWDGGDLLCCDLCPASYHPDCLGLGPDAAASLTMWTCPQHACAVCQKKAGAVGGMLFRCEGCPHAYCEDHLPEAGVDIVKECARFAAMGWRQTATACFVRCTPRCARLVEALNGEASGVSVAAQTKREAAVAGVKREDC